MTEPVNTAIDFSTGVTLAGVVLSAFTSWVVSKNEQGKQAVKDAEWRGRVAIMVNAMWSVVFRNATQEGLNTGLLERNSPIRTNLDAFVNHPVLIKRLHEFYEKEGKKLSDLDLLVQIEKRFSEELSAFEQEHHLRAAASLAAACYLLRPGMQLFKNFHYDKLDDQPKIDDGVKK